jgi:hypothetical protein
MAKRKRENNEKQNEKKRKEGRGQGNFENYKPWLRIQDVGSQGLAVRIKGTKSGRIHHFLSTLEQDYFYMLSWSEEVIDIREQYPLDLKETKALAKEARLIHPPRSNPQKPIVMTTDFLITIRQPIGTKEVARTVKYSKDLTNLRVIEKFEIERLYWKERKIDWGIVTELDINKTLVRNLKWFYRFLEIDSLPSEVIPIIPQLVDYMLPRIKEGYKSLKEITKDCDKRFSLPTGNSLALVRHLLATQKWRVNVHQPIQPEKVLNLISEKGEEK